MNFEDRIRAAFEAWSAERCQAIQEPSWKIDGIHLQITGYITGRKCNVWVPLRGLDGETWTEERFRTWISIEASILFDSVMRDAVAREYWTADEYAAATGTQYRPLPCPLHEWAD